MGDAGLMEFLGQLPLFFIVMFCGSAVALVFSVALIINARRQKAQRAEVRAAQPSSAAALPLMRYDSGEMPDLDSLLQSPPPPTPARPTRPGVQPVRLTDGESVEAIELLSLMRDVTGGGLIVQINDKTYRVAGNMSDPEFRTKLKSLMKEVATALGGSAPLVQPPSYTAPANPESSAPPAAPAAPVEPRFSPPSPGITSAAFDLPKFSLENTSTPMTRKELKQQFSTPIPQIDIAGAIEAYLQHKLVATGLFTGRQIHVKPARDGGIRIQVDDQFYEAVGDVTEPDIQAFLKATIAEWQDRQ